MIDFSRGHPRLISNGFLKVRTQRASLLAMGSILLVVCLPCLPQEAADRPVNEQHIVYHDVRVDARGGIVPWFSDDPSQAYDHDIRLVWNFWLHMRKSPDGVPYYLQHQVWKADRDDPRGLGGDQINMALDSWDLLYDYLGDPAILDNMVMMADYWLDHGMSRPDALWPNLPFPYNTDVESGQYDGDMCAGKGFLQPDKAGSFGAELVMLYKKTGNPRYLDGAIKIANVLATKVKPGNADDSPWPFRVNAFTGKVDEQQNKDTHYKASYTTNWTPTLRLFRGLEELKQGRIREYRRASTLVITWLKTYPVATNRWGPFFEDVGFYSDTEINADTLAEYILENPDWGTSGPGTAASALRWSEQRLGNHNFEKLQVVPQNEQTLFAVPGNSHTARHGFVQLLYCEKTGNCANKQAAIRRLNWATYSVDSDGKNCFPTDDVWLTDGYGDYVRHYLRAMAAARELAPKDQNHLLQSSSVIQHIEYGSKTIVYKKFDAKSSERFKLGAATPRSMQGGTMRWNEANRVLSVKATSPNVTVLLKERGEGQR